jgi:hypothetical protein
MEARDIYKTEEDIYQIVGETFQRLMELPKLVKSVVAAKLVIQLNYTNPSGRLTIDCRQDPPQIIFGPTDIKPTISMTASIDVAHSYYAGKLNLGLAVTTGKIKASGPMNKFMKLLPLLKPIHQTYLGVLEERGYKL